MKYVLKYTIKSKYLHFTREYYKDFDDTFDVFNYVINNKIANWKLYQEKKYIYNTTDLLKGEEYEKRNTR